MRLLGTLPKTCTKSLGDRRFPIGNARPFPPRLWWLSGSLLVFCGSLTLIVGAGLADDRFFFEQQVPTLPTAWPEVTGSTGQWTRRAESESDGRIHRATTVRPSTLDAVNRRVRQRHPEDSRILTFTPHRQTRGALSALEQRASTVTAHFDSSNDRTQVRHVHRSGSERGAVWL